MLDRYLEAAADAVPATGETAGRGKSAGNTLAVGTIDSPTVKMITALMSWIHHSSA